LLSSSSSGSSIHFADSTGEEAETEDAHEDADELLDDIVGRKVSGHLFRCCPSDGRLMLSGVVGVRGEDMSL